MSLQLFSERLKNDRVERGLTQDQMALAIKMSKRSYCAYEAGETSPSAKLLAALTSMGSDVGYLLTGERTGGVQPALDAAERVLLDNYRRCKPEGQAHLIQSSALLSAGLASAAPPAQAKPRPKAQVSSGASVTQTFHGTVRGGVNQTFHGPVQGDVVNGVPAAGKTARGRGGVS